MSSIPSIEFERISYAAERAEQEARLTHPLTTEEICQPAEQELTDESADWGCDFDAEILMRVQFLVGTVDIAQHRRGDVDGEDIVAADGLELR